MFARDVPQIVDHASNPDGLADVIMFAVLSIQQPFRSLPRQMADVRRKGRDSAYLWGWKRDTFDYVQEHKGELFARLRDAWDAEDAIDILTDVPGLGLVKAGFVAQMLGYDVACLDTRNLIDLGLPLTAFKFDKAGIKKPETRRRKIADYVKFCRDTGGSEHWWNHWCAGLANVVETADQISRAHVDVICAA
jgi:hypothetical protein